MHAVHYFDMSCRKSESAITKECQRFADSDGDYKGQISRIRFSDRIKKSREEAVDWISLNDSGWYDNLAIKYKDGRKIMWLVKIEYHC